jgi:hypothetical protein
MTPAEQHFPMHGFSFESAEERQRVAESHHLWPDFVRRYNRAWNEEPPQMSDVEARTFYEFFIAGGLAQANYAVAQAEEHQRQHAAWIAGEKPNEDACERCANCQRYQFPSIAESALEPYGTVRVCKECLAFESTEVLNRLIR